MAKFSNRGSKGIMTTVTTELKLKAKWTFSRLKRQNGHCRECHKDVDCFSSFNLSGTEENTCINPFEASTFAWDKSCFYSLVHAWLQGLHIMAQPFNSRQPDFTLVRTASL